MRRPYEPTIRTDERGDFVVADEEPVRAVSIDPMTGRELAGPSVDQRIYGMLFEALRGTSAPAVRPAARIPEHLRQYVK